MLNRLILLLPIIVIIVFAISGCGVVETITPPSEAGESFPSSRSNAEIEPEPSPTPTGVSNTATPRVTKSIEDEVSFTENEAIPATSSATEILPITEEPEATATTNLPEATATTNLMVNDLSLSAEGITVFPVPIIYEGDLVSFQIAPHVPRGLAPNDVDVRILVDGSEMVHGNLNWRKLSGDTVGLYQWVWDTTGQVGEHTISATVDPNDLIQIGDENHDNNQAEITLQVQPISALPEPEAAARWITAENECCRIHVVSDTAAHRDISKLLIRIDEAFSTAATKLEVPLVGPYDIYLIDRVMGQGGYTIDSSVVSYLDRNYAGGGISELLVHEASHLLDKQFAPDHISFLSEGVAVWVAGGHYKQQNLGEQMTALIELRKYVPLVEMIDDFTSIQHEIGYLEAASFINYLVERYDWPLVREFYSSATADDGDTLSAAIEANTLFYFGRDLESIESDWLSYLAQLPRNRFASLELQSTIRFYEVMRRYQTLYDPTAYYIYAWLPSPEEAEKWGATADFSRHPESLTNLTLEVMLATANKALIQEDYKQLNALLNSVGRVMNNDGLFLDPLAKSYLSVVEATDILGYETQRVEVNGDRATVLANSAEEVKTRSLRFRLDQDGNWTLIQ